MKRLADIATVILAVCAVIITTLVVRREVRGSQPVERPPREIAAWDRIAGAGHRLGPPNAPVRIVKFSDFQCPFCAVAQGRLAELRQRYPDQVVVVYRHFPLERIHPVATAAAHASECAAEQGRFEAMHDRLYAAQDSIGVKSFAAFAAEAGVPDAQEFQRCVDEGRYSANIARDVKAARSIRLDGTPSIIVEGMLAPGTPSMDQLEHWTEQALVRAGPR